MRGSGTRRAFPVFGGDAGARPRSFFRKVARQAQALRLDRASRRHHGQTPTWESGVGATPLADEDTDPGPGISPAEAQGRSRRDRDHRRRIRDTTLLEIVGRHRRQDHGDAESRAATDDAVLRLRAPRHPIQPESVPVRSAGPPPLMRDVPRLSRWRHAQHLSPGRYLLGALLSRNHADLDIFYVSYVADDFFL